MVVVSDAVESVLAVVEFDEEVAFEVVAAVEVVDADSVAGRWIIGPNGVLYTTTPDSEVVVPVDADPDEPDGELDWALDEVVPDPEVRVGSSWTREEVEPPEFCRLAVEVARV